jgi:SpoVK/Ycf46/Vps4 family AAA+-type ATPase
MITARQMIALLQSLNEGDDEQFYAIALQVAATEAKRGRVEVATELQAQVDVARARKNAQPRLQAKRAGSVVAFSRPRGELDTLLSTSLPKTTLKNLTLDDRVANRLRSFVSQQRQRDKLRQHGRTPKRKLLLVGPPGSGKTFTASAIAGELHMALHVIRLDAVISRFMGETASKLRLVFDQIAVERAVYLFDEFDAIGGKRSSDNDVGEMRRVLNSFLQFLEEESGTDSLVVAATNHPELLDPALLRRFDDVILYPLPTVDMIIPLLQDRLSFFQTSFRDWTDVSAAGLGLSQAEIVKAADDVGKDAILSGQLRIHQDQIEAALTHRRALSEILNPSK